MTQPTVAERLLSGTVSLIDADGGADLSVRRLAEASGRSTMCVYTYYQGRANLLAAAHRDASEDLLAELAASAEPSLALGTYAAEHPRMLLWLLTAEETGSLVEQRNELAAALLSRLSAQTDEPTARRRLAEAVGDAVLRPLLPSTAPAIAGH